MFQYSRSLATSCGSLLLLIALLGADPAKSKDIVPLIAPLQVQSHADAEKTFDALIATGPEGVAKLISMLVDPGKGDDLKVRFAIAGLTQYASRPGADKDRTMVADALAAGLASNITSTNKELLLQQLAFVGKPSNVPAIAALLTDAELCEPASLTLRRIRSREASAAIEAAFLKAEGPTRLPLTGALRVSSGSDSKTIAQLAKFSTDADPKLKETALQKLARSGAPSAAAPLATGCIAGLSSPSRAAQGHAAGYALLYVSRLKRQNKANEAKAFVDHVSAAAKDESLKRLLTSSLTTEPTK